jgi:hypothetical protein
VALPPENLGTTCSPRTTPIDADLGHGAPGAPGAPGAMAVENGLAEVV